jgi:hypothetical protein
MERALLQPPKKRDRMKEGKKNLSTKRELTRTTDRGKHRLNPAAILCITLIFLSLYTVDHFLSFL